MNRTRRQTLKLAGASISAAVVTGCVGDDGQADDVVSEYDTVQLAVRTGLGPDWPDGEDATGRAVVIDSEERQESALFPYEPDEDRHDELAAFFEEIDYDTDRLILVESVGPDACHSHLEIGNVRVENGDLRADATVEDVSGPDEDCAAVVVHPSALLRVTFVDVPKDEIAVDVTDGRGEESTVTASVDDPLSPDPADLDGYVQPEGEPDPVEALVCDDAEFERHYQGYDDGDVQLGETERDGEPALAMRASDTEYARGDTVEIRLRNVADEPVTTGNSAKFNLQVYTEEGWQDVRGADGGTFPYTDEAIVHPPGTGFEWSFELTETGVVEDASHDFRVCPGLSAGRYRFAFWGVIGDGALAVEFDLVD